MSTCSIVRLFLALLLGRSMCESVVGVFCPWSSCQFVCVNTWCSVLGFVIGVGSEFAVSDECSSDDCDWAWGRGVSVGARGVCVGDTRGGVVCHLLMTCMWRVCCVD